MNPTRIEYIRRVVALSNSEEPEWTFEMRHEDRTREEAKGQGQWLKGMRCLDVGCGGGLLSESLARLGGEVVGLDASAENIGIARTHARQDPFLPFVEGGGEGEVLGDVERGTVRDMGGRIGRLEYRHTSAEKLRDAGEKFDLVCAMEVLEHVDEPGEFLKCLGEMVKVGQRLLTKRSYQKYRGMRQVLILPSPADTSSSPPSPALLFPSSSLSHSPRTSSVS
jgi:2-polyprenyl-6-hydroxyphenyl methylase/3-demethylubiquinone-9 3-methyltransferase